VRNSKKAFEKRIFFRNCPFVRQCCEEQEEEMMIEEISAPAPLAKV